ncbi:MAG: hypothetical protein NTY59_04910 [Alphaproteobacteria bacterium]|nr:hypothetical protein [Alphaproteobacteria bacterium]
MAVDFIFMLTRDDMTVENCLEVFEEAAPIGLAHVGFKDVGVSLQTLRKLNQAIQATGATSYLEVVSTSPEACLRSAAKALEIGVDCVLGGKDIEAMLTALKGGKATYMPFVGRTIGHPTRLGGSPDDIAQGAARALALGCVGVDLLAYRATEAQPLDLIRAARAAMPTGQLVVAGSIDSPERVDAVADAGADAFTVGTAVFDRIFAPEDRTLAGQLRAIRAACA